MAKPASLTSSLVAKKGQAMPAAHTPVDLPQQRVNLDKPNQSASPPAPASEEGYYKALTVKLDRTRYEALKSLGVQLDMKSQEIFVAALDAYMRDKRG